MGRSGDSTPHSEAIGPRGDLFQFCAPRSRHASARGSCADCWYGRPRVGPCELVLFGLRTGIRELAGFAAPQRGSPQHVDQWRTCIREHDQLQNLAMEARRARRAAWAIARSLQGGSRAGSGTAPTAGRRPRAGRIRFSTPAGPVPSRTNRTRGKSGRRRRHSSSASSSTTPAPHPIGRPRIPLSQSASPAAGPL